jgi:7-carboxy-7-deazaguanine synthase
MESKTLAINEIFYSIQGESSYAGLPCVFIRLRGCHLRCRYCDTTYAFHEGEKQSIASIIDSAENVTFQADQSATVLTVGRNISDSYGSTESHWTESAVETKTASDSQRRLIEVTGGEPLLQPNVHLLMSELCDRGHTVLIETSGACDISVCDPRVIRIMDLKTPGSGEAHRNFWGNLANLNARDEVKFVLTSRDDYDWMAEVLQREKLADRVGSVLVSAVHDVPAGGGVEGCEGLSLTDLSQWVLADQLPVRVQTQLHKLIWDPTARGV